VTYEEQPGISFATVPSLRAIWVVALAKVQLVDLREHSTQLATHYLQVPSFNFASKINAYPFLQTLH
jgi:hypothetical protein